MLTHCEHCRERLLDYAYGLLEVNELQETQSHLEVCAECQADLVTVQTEQKLLARAAKPITQVPEFTLPSVAPAAVPLEAAVKSLADTLPYPGPVAKKRSLWRRPWVAWVAAAAILLVVAAPVVWYRNTVNGYQRDVAFARAAHKDIELALATLPATYEPRHKAAIHETRAKANPYLHVVGPKTLEPNAKGHIDITTRHPEGELAACNLRIKLFEADTNNIVEVARLASDGRVRVEIDAAGAKANTPLTLLVEAETPFGMSNLQEIVKVQAPTYVTRIDTNKLLYQSRDVLFFRVLVLDRCTLQPPSQPIPMRVALVHDKKPVRTLEQKTGVGGILAAEFAVEEAYPEGSYTLEVSPIDPSKTTVQSASAPLEFVRDLPGIRLDQDRYLPGAIVTGNLTLRGDQMMPDRIVGKLDGQAIPITLQPQTALPGFGGGSFSGNAPNLVNKDKDAAKALERVYRFQTAPIPADVTAGANQLRLTVPLPSDSKKKELGKQELGTFIPLEPTDFAIDFFPEGGDLIAGVQNRLFYRVRSKTGTPISGEGRVMLLTGKNDVVDSSYQLGMGYLDFTPDLKESYTVRITTPAKVENVATPFTKLGGIRGEGVVLQVADPNDEHAPKAVGIQGDPIRVTLRRQGLACKLLLVAHCRGQIVDQRWVEVKKEPVDVTLQPTPEAHGMIRVTAYEVVGDTLEPSAERLVYRAPTSRLDLGFAPSVSRYQPGRTTSAKVSAVAENGKPAKAWILASVVDERFQSKPRSLSAHFLLMNEIRTGPDLDNAQIILHDSPESVQVLERFLGTHGWRRYVPAREQTIVAAGKDAPLATALVFSRASMPLETLQKRYQDKIDQALTPIRQGALEEQARLESERERLASAVNILAEQLYNFETQVQLWIRLGLGMVLALLLLVSLMLMSVGAYRILRAHKTATPAFGSAFACLAACLGILFGGAFLGRLDNADLANVAQVGPFPKDALFRAGLEKLLAQGPQVREVHEQTPTGAFALRAERKEAEQQVALDGPDKKLDEAKKKEWAKAFQNELVMNFARDRGESAALAKRRNMAAENIDLQNRFEQARAALAAAPGPEHKAAKITPAPAKPDAPPTKAGIDRGGARQLEYPFQNGPNSIGDTLLWHPTLFLANGSAEVRFDIAPGQATTYRVLLLGHSPTGRFGFYETRLDVPAYIGR